MSEKPEGTTRREFVAASAGAAAVAAFGFSRVAQAADGDELVTQLVKLKIKEGQEDAAVELLQALTAAVEKGEPGVLAYIAHRAKNDPSDVVFFEVYKDQAALTAHRTTPHMAELGPKFGQIFDMQSFDIQPLDRVGGFAR